MKTVSQIINSVSYREVAEAHLRLYDEEPVNYDAFKTDLNKAVAVVDPEDDMVIIFSEWNEMIDVCGESQGQRWSLSFTPLGTLKTYMVNSKLPLADQAAHLYYEFTWYGLGEAKEERFSAILDSVEEVKRMFDE